MRFYHCFGWLLVVAGSMTSGYLAAAEPELRFARDILPILSDNCFQCHGPDDKGGREGDLRLDDETDVKRKRDDYHVIAAGDPENSELLTRVTSKEDGYAMPPLESDRSLSEKQVATLRRWIEQGAPWGKHWALERVERPSIDATDRNPIDVLIERRLAENKIVPNSKATRETLIRRLSLDLTGIPPTVQQIDAFLADDQPGAWERLVDRTLASPRFGERMAWDWMEVARYADSNGYQNDRERTMWPWRDWVVQAFNNNLPYDQFTIWQLAGDLLPNATEEQQLATGFNRNHMINGEGGRIPEENRVDYVMDMTETMGTAWLGMTLTCCRCHNHKFDPITQRNYYELTAFFNQTPVSGSGGDPQTAPVLAVPSAQQRNELVKLREQAAGAKIARDQHWEKMAASQSKWEAQWLAKQDSVWTSVVFDSLTSQNGQTIAMQPSGTILTSGKNPDNDTYLLTTKSPLRKIASLWLEAVRHPDMTKGGFARSNSGNFVLTEIELQWRVSDTSPWQSVEWSTATATFEQNGYKVAGAIDKKPSTGWAVYDGKPMTRDQSAVFQLKSPIELPKGAAVRITLKHDSRHAAHNLGHFRVSLSDKPGTGLPEKQSKLIASVKVPPNKRSAEQRAELRRRYEESDATMKKLTADVKQIEDKITKLQASYPKVMVMKDLGKPRKTYFLDRGIYTERRDEVNAAVPESLPPLPKTNDEPTDMDKAPNRLALARWLVSRDHPLTSRVTVNRFWQMLFGVGLVKTAEDFGVQGEFPVQPELLDWLAAELMESRWDVKHLLRQVVTSDAYQRSSKIASPAVYQRDPENRLLARGPRFRLPSWMIRDQALAVSGLLNPAIGGKPIFTYQPMGIWSEATFGKKKYQQDSGEALYRRSLYIFWRRIVGPTVFFDTAKRQVCEVKPLRTNTPLHALTTLNDVTYVEAARALANSVLQSEESAENRLSLIARRVLGRHISQAERDIWQRSLERARKAFAADSKAAETFLSHGEFRPGASVDKIELAAWSAFCLNVLNLDETVTKE